MGRIIGIDLGTTNSVAAYWSRKRPKPVETASGSFFTPSVVMIQSGRRIVGQDARSRLETLSRDIVYSIKRFMGRDFDDEIAQAALQRVGYQVRRAANGEVEVSLGGQYYSPVQISAMILEQIRKDAEVQLGEEVTHAVITVPAYFGQRQREATRLAGQLAGLIVPRIINEPTAAALAFGVSEELDEPQDILVFDLGGGTFDVSILSVIDTNFDVLHIDGDNFLGGDDFDQRLVDHILQGLKREKKIDLDDDPVARYRLKAEAERAKIELSRSQEAAIVLDTISGARGYSLRVTRRQFEALVEDLVDRSIAITRRALADADLRVEDLDRVLLVGGMTRMPLVRERLRALFGDRIEIDVDPMQCVALGAAVMTAALTEEELAESAARQDVATAPPVVVEKSADMPEIFVQDMLSKFIGVETAEGRVKVVIPKGRQYPSEPDREEFYTEQTGQTFYLLPVYEAEREDDPRDKWEWIGVVENDRLPPGLPKDTAVMVEMHIDSDGILAVSSWVKSDEADTRVEKSFHFGGRQRQEDQALEAVDLWSTALEDIANQPFLNKYLLPGQAERARRLVAEAKPVLEAKDETRARDVLQRMEALLSELPVPTLDVFFASVAISGEQSSAIDRSQMQQTVAQMDQAASRGDYDAANAHLDQLRKKTGELWKKLPSGLLKASRFG